jgi:hypothetical protein
MAIYQYKAGIGNAGSYQVSGTPYLTGSILDGAGANNGEIKIEFPSVTKNILVVNTSASVPIIVHFNSRTDPGNVISGHHYFTLEDKKDSVTFGAKCKQIYISLESPGIDGSFELAADLTAIERKEMFELTGSGLTD